VELQRISGEGDHLTVETVQTFPGDGVYHFCVLVEFATGRSLARFGITGSPDGIRFIGVRVNHGSPEGAAFRPFAGDALRDLRSSSGFSRKSNHWPAYQMAPSPAGEFWEDLSGHRDQLLEIIESAWTKFSGPVDEAVTVALDRVVS
jgi:hypothetical protein